MSISLASPFSIVTGDALASLRRLPDDSIHCCVTSPPYWQQCDYCRDGQLGQERSSSDYIENLVEVFREVRRILRPDGTLWLNLGDKYRRKQLLGLPWRVALSLQDDGWFLRSDCIWAKPNGMPESVTDRPTKSHEYVFMLCKSANSFYDLDAVRTPHAPGARLVRTRKGAFGTAMRGGMGRHHKGSDMVHLDPRGKNIRTVWTMKVGQSKSDHFAMFPTTLAEHCIKASCPKGGVVLDSFSGHGSTGAAALMLGRRYVGIELNADYNRYARKRLRKVFQDRVDVE